CDICGRVLHESVEPMSPLGAVLLGVADDGHGTCYEQPSQVAITLLGDAAEPLLAAGRVLLGHQPDPGSKIAPRAEHPPVADFGNQRGGHDWADARDLLQATARFARILLSIDLISAPIALYCRASTSRRPRTAGATRLSVTSVMMPSN